MGVVAPETAAGHELPVLAVFLDGVDGVVEAAIFLKTADIRLIYQRIQNCVGRKADQHDRQYLGNGAILADLPRRQGAGNGADHEHIDADVFANVGEVHCLGIGPEAGGGHGEGTAGGLLDQAAGELRYFIVAEKVELAVAVSQQADRAAPGYADLNDIAEPLPV